MFARHPRDSAVSASVGTCPACGANLLKGDRFCGGCGTPVPYEADTELLADLQQVTLGEHEILGILGRGGMGLVYLAHDISLNRKVAIKVLPPSMLQGEAAVERFRREARIAASLRHRCITSVFGLKETTKVVFFVMEYVEGRTLDAILHDEGKLEIGTVEAIMHDTGMALSYAHRREVVHRDLKPANVIIDAEGMAMITDFGVAKITTSQGLTTPGSTVGSPKYMSPEQWSGKASSMSDQYALGCVAYELLAGRAPFEGETIEELMKQHLSDVPRPVLELRPDCPPALADAVMRMLEKDPTKRWPSLDAAIAAVGLRPVPPDDPVRVGLAAFAKRGHDVRALPKTPKSPIPISRLSPQPEVRRSSPGLQRALLWAAGGGVLVLVAAGAYVVGIAVNETKRVNAIAKDTTGNVPSPRPVEPSPDRVEPRPSRVEKRGNTRRAAPKVPKPSPVPVTVKDPGRGMPGVVQIVVTPSATVSIDGRKGVLRTHGLDDTLSAGAPHRLRFESPGLKTIDTTVTLLQGEKRVLRIQMTALTVGTKPAPRTDKALSKVAAPAGRMMPGVVQIVLTPSANVSIDGRKGVLRTHGVEDTLSAGAPHRLRFEGPGLKTLDTTVTLLPGEKRVLRIQMTPSEKAPGKKTARP